MRPKKLLTGVGFAALALSGCGAVKVQPSSSAGSSKLASRGSVDRPYEVRGHLGCLRAAHLSVQVLSPTRLQINPAPSGPTIVFAATPGAAQADQIDGSAQAAEVIGSALVYPHQGSDGELGRIRTCLSQGVQG